MYARIVTITGAKDLDAGIRWLREQLPPALKDLKGFRGLGVNVDRTGGVIGVLTLWDTESDRDASWDALAARRQESLDSTGGQLSMESYEEMLRETGSTPPAPGSSLMLLPVSMDPAKVDENLAFFRSNILPQLRASRGFQQVRLLMDRKTGQGMGGTVWADEDAMRAADDQAGRQETAPPGVRFGEASYRELVFTDF
jgi:heme-degrading monooxygenase HmoA